MERSGERIYQKETLRFNPGQVAFALCTRYRTWKPGEGDISDTVKVRGDLALEFIHRAVSEGYKVVVMDAGSSPSWLERLPENTVKVDFKENNFGKQKAAAILEASKVPGVVAIIRTEGEKVDVLNHVIKLTSPIINGKADMVVGSRNEPDFGLSYPDYGYREELRTKKLLNKILKMSGINNRYGRNIDFYSGIDVFRNDSKILGLVAKRYRYVGPVKVNTSHRGSLDGWFHAQVGTMIEAKAKGLKVRSVGVNFKYDKRQRENEEINIDIFRAKRKMQAQVAVQPAIQLVRYLKGDKGSLFEEEHV